IMTELNIGVLKVNGLDLKGAMGGSIQEGMQRRLNGGNLMKSVYRMMAIDKDKEDFQFVNRTVTGVPEVMDRFMTAVAASTDMTELVLFGKSPTGLNASQEEQMQVWYDKVEARREDELAPNIQVVMDVLTRGNSPDWEFEQLWKMSDTQKADVMQKSAAALQSVSDIAGLTPEEARRQLNTLEAWDLEEDDAPPPDMTGGSNETY
ncbi:MAG: anti-CBASS protein Acb1 family protein, partial [Aeromonas veronii]